MLVGREVELRELEDAISQARAGRASVTVLHGDAGIGKSALLAAVTEPVDGSLVLRISGHAAESELPHAGLHQLLSPLGAALDRLPDPQQRALRQALALEVGQPVDQLATASAVLRLITSEAEARTVVIVADDFQWLDPSTRQVLIFMARRIDADAVAVLIAQRGRLREELSGVGRPVRVGPMAAPEAKELLRRECPQMSSMVVHKVLERAAGLPLALIEIPAELTAEQQQASEPLPSRFPVGESIERLYETRIARLDDRARIALLVASFEDLAPADLADALSHAGLGVGELDAAERHHLVRVEDGRCVFAHPTVRGAIQIEATSAELLAAHEALAACFAADAPRFAVYAQGCASIPDEDVARALQAAARQAQDQGGFAEAATAWEAASHRAATDVVRRDHRARAIECHLRAGSGRQALPLLATTIDDARDDLERAQWLCTRVVATTWVEGRPPRDSEDLVAFGTGLLSGGSERIARGVDLLMALATCQFTWGAYGAGKALADVVRRVVPAADLPIGHRLTCENLDVMVGAPGAGAFLRTNWIDDIGPEQVADPSIPIGFSGVALGWLDELDACERVATRCRELTAAHTGLAATKLAIGSMSVITIERTGAWDRAALEYAQAERVSIDGDFTAPYPYIALRRAYLLATQGKEAECHALRELALSGLTRRSPAIDHLDGCVRGMLELALGNHGRAAELLAESAAIERRMGTLCSGLTSRFVDQFEASWWVGRAADLAAELVAFSALAESMAHPTMRATAARCEALLADADAMDEAFAEVLRLQGGMRNVFEAARTEYLWGVRLRRARRKADARDHLRAAEHQFAGLDAVGWLVRTRSELAACGERRAGGSSRAGPLSALTPREFEVAKAVAHGASNPEAAEQLFISQRTVEYHLSSVFRKLEVPSRHALAPFFAGS